MRRERRDWFGALRVGASPEKDQEIDESERGAILLLLTVFLVIFMVVAALAVDLSALERRGQTLQNTADAAALAGVATWQQTGDANLARQRINDLVRQNGVSGSDIVVGIDFPSSTEVTVVVGDTRPEIFMGSFVPGYDPQVERIATARLDDCSAACTKPVTIPRPPNPIPATGSGDGYLPISIGDRFYAVNHDNNKIACVDRITETACWTNRYAYTSGPNRPVTGPVAHHVVVDDRIWWTAQEPTQLGLYCWDTSTENPCIESFTVFEADRADSLGVTFQQRGGGIVNVGTNIFVFTDDHRVHCFSAVLLTRCYPGGNLSTLGEEAFPVLSEATRTSGSNIDRIVNEDTGQIFHTMHVRDSAESQAAFPDTGVFLGCFDTRTMAACGAFDSHKLHDAGNRQEGRLFFYRDTSGQPIGVCSTGYSTIECTDLFGDERTDFELSLAPVANELPPASQYGSGMGAHMWHEPTNRLFMVTPRKFSINHCVDFSVAGTAYCGAIPGQVPGMGPTQDYGFVYAENSNCVFALGHTSIFWAFEADDLSPGCPGDTATTRVNPCPCDGGLNWGKVTFKFDVGSSSLFSVLNVQVKDPDGNVVLPAGGGWESVLGSTSGEIVLSDVPTTHAYLDVVVYAEATSDEPWETGEPPTFVFGFEDNLPYLTN